jgi:hypothetical protein
MNLVNVVSQDAFNVISLSNFINDITPQYGRLGALGLFIDEGVTQNIVGVDYDPITNQLLPQVKWGAPGVANKTATGKLKTFAIPHYVVNDNVLAADVMGRRAPGTNDTLTVQRLLGKKMAEMKLKLEQTLEWERLGVLKSGQVKDGAGNLILDIYSDFGISQTSTSFATGTSTTDIMGKIALVKRLILAALRGDLMRGWVALCSDGFYDAFVSHANVQKAFTYYQNNGQNLAGDYSGANDQPNSAGLFSGGEKPFIFGNVAWINYTGSVSDSAGSSQPMIDANAAYLFPMGTQVFKNWFAPADYLETVNTEGLPFYAKQKLMDYDKGIDVECQSNPLPICLKPAVVQKLTTS